MANLAAASVAAILAWNLAAAPANAQGVRAAPFRIGDVYSVESEETLRGYIEFQPPGGGASKKLPYKGNRKSRYVERVLDAKSADDSVPERVLRRIEELDSVRTIGDNKPEKGFPLRDAGRHVVVHRGEAFSKPFSLKGPLKNDEIHTLSHLVFVPALNGLLSTEPLTVGMKWTANRRAVAQLAGLVPLESGELACTLKKLDFNFNGETLVQVGFKGILKGNSEEGNVADDVDGSLYLYRSTGKIHSLTVEGIRTMYDKDWKNKTGELELKYTVSIRSVVDQKLDDATAAEAAKDPTPEQTAVLYDYPPCAVELVHPRAWLLDSVDKTTLNFAYGKEGHQMTLNFHKDDETPSVADYFKEVEGNLKREKFENVKWTIDAAEKTDGERGTAGYRRFGQFEATAKKDGDWRMRYLVWQKGKRGVTVGVFTHSQAASEGKLVGDGWNLLRGLSFTGDRNPFFVKPKEPEKK